MYAAFIVSGAVDVIGFYAPAGLLPQGTEHVRHISALSMVKNSAIIIFLKTTFSWSQHIPEA